MNVTYSKSFFSAQQQGSRRSAEVVIPLAMATLNPTSVVDVGCGVGAWLSVFRDHGVTDVLGIDGSYVQPQCLQIPRASFRPHDLRQPLRLDRVFDLVVSLEVAEHLPASCSGVFIDTLTRLGPVILFSAAIPYQGGAHHLNEQWPGYWAELFEQRGYRVIDCLRRRIWNNRNVDWCYAQNILIFARPESIERNPALERGLAETHPSQLDLVHPLKYMEQCDPDHITLRNLARWLPVLAIGLPRILSNAIERHRKSPHRR